MAFERRYAECAALGEEIRGMLADVEHVEPGAPPQYVEDHAEWLAGVLAGVCGVLGIEVGEGGPCGG